MEYRRLGTTDISVSAIGLGLAAIGRPGYINLGHDGDLAGHTERSALQRHTHEVLDFAFAEGVTYIDGARSYGRAEEFLATWLASRELSPDEVVVGSKWGYRYEANWSVDATVHEVKIHTHQNLDQQYEESLGLLGTHLRLYQIHSATPASGVLDDMRVLERLAQLREHGLVIGLSTSGPDQASMIRRALEIEVDGAMLFGVVQSTWNLLERSAGEALADASDAGLGVIVKEAVANGRLTSRNPDVAQRLQSIAPEWPPDAVAIAACLHQPWSSVVLSGAATTSQLSSNIRALEVPRTVTSRLASLQQDADEYWWQRSGLPWN